MDLNMKGNLKMINFMAKEKNNGQIILFIKDLIIKEKNKDKEYSHGLINLFMKVYFLIINSMDMVNMFHLILLI